MEITRKIKITGDDVKIVLTAEETTNSNGLKQIYAKISSDLYQLQGEAENKRSMLKEIEKVAETPEILAFVKQLETAQQVMAKEEVKSELKDFDVRISGKERELAELSKYFVQIQKEEKEKDGY